MAIISPGGCDGCSYPGEEYKMILEEKTFEKFGYYPGELKPKSSKKILAACDKCGKVRINRKSMYRALCRKCSNKPFGRALNRMYQFEDLYSRFLSGCTPWETVVEEIEKKAKQANPYALNIWRFLDEDFSYSEQVRSAIETYYSNMLPFKRTIKAR